MTDHAVPSCGSDGGDWRPADDRLHGAEQIGQYEGIPAWKVRLRAAEGAPGMWFEGKILVGSKKKLRDEHCRRAGLLIDNL